MTETAQPGSEKVDRLPHVGLRDLLPGLSAATMPRANGLTEIAVGAQPFVTMIYARRGRDLLAPVAGGFGDLRVRARSVTLIPAGLATHWLYAAPVHDRSPQLQTLHLRLTPRLADTLEPAAGLGALRPAMNLQVPGLSHRMERALRVFETPAAFPSVALQSVAIEAVLCLLDPAAARPPEAASLTARRRRALTDYVEDNLAGDISLAGMAASVGLSPFHFLRAFKAATGMTPYAWVVERRVERVKLALLRGGLGLAEVATLCGFATQSHMTEVFRRTTGVTPGRWRAGQRGTGGGAED